MARSLSLLILLSIFSLSAAASGGGHGGASNFIKSKCRATTYPTLCVESLASFSSTIKQNPRQLVQTALSISLSRAQSTQSYVSKLSHFKNLKPREFAAIKDCAEEVGDTVDRLSKSVEELKRVHGAKEKEFQWHMSNVETWVSAAITDENTCSDGFAGPTLNGRVKSSVRARIVEVTRVISNALALINKYAGN